MGFNFQQYLRYQWFQMKLVLNFIRQWHKYASLVLLFGSLISLYITAVFVYEVSDYLSLQYEHLHPLEFSHAIKRGLDGLFFFISFVVLIGVVEVLFRGHQMAEKEHLRIFPIHERTLFAIKINDIAISIYVFYVPFIVIPFILSASQLHLSWTVLLYFCISLFLLILQIVFVTFSICLLAVYIAPRYFWKNIFGIGIAVGILLYLLFSVTRFFQSTGFIGTSFLEYQYFPTQLTIEIMRNWYFGDYLGVHLSFLSNVLLTFVLGILCYLFYFTIFVHQADTLQQKVGPQRIPGKRFPKLFTAIERRVPQFSRVHISLIRKELLSLIRDPSLKIAFFAGLLLSVFPFLPLLLIKGRVAEMALEIIIFVVFLFCIHFVLFICLSSTGRESDAIQNIRLYPLKLSVFIRAKASVYYFAVFFVIYSGLLGFLFLKQIQMTHFIIVAGGTFLIAAVHAFFLVGMTFHLGCIFPRFQSQNQFRAVSLWAIGLFISLSFFYLVSTSICFWAVYRFGLWYIFHLALVYFFWILVLVFLYRYAQKELSETLSLFRI